MMLENKKKENMVTQKSNLRKIVIPTLLPVLGTVIWVMNKFAESDLLWWQVLGISILTTLIPVGLGIWYGWDLRKEYENEQD